jgi:hypothetical protein
VHREHFGHYATKWIDLVKPCVGVHKHSKLDIALCDLEIVLIDGFEQHGDHKSIPHASEL